MVCADLDVYGEVFYLQSGWKNSDLDVLYLYVREEQCSIKKLGDIIIDRLNKYVNKINYACICEIDYPAHG